MGDKGGYNKHGVDDMVPLSVVLFWLRLRSDRAASDDSFLLVTFFSQPR